MGNICRSPTAKGFLDKHLLLNGLASKVKVDSAGTHGYHLGHQPDSRSQAAALQLGVDISTDYSRQIDHEDFYNYDEILVMDQRNLDDIHDVQPSDNRATIQLIMQDSPDDELDEVPDPYYGVDAGFKQIAEMLDQVAAAICQRLTKQIK